MTKRQAEEIDVDDVVSCINLDKGLIDGLLNLTDDELVAVLADVANKAQITTVNFKKARISLPSFSTVKWSNFAEQYGLSQKPEQVRFEDFSTPRYRLPPTFHKMMFENAWRSQDVYREPPYQTRGEAKLRILDPYIVPIIALFQGRVIDQPEEAMTGTEYSTGGEVEHEIFMIGGILFFIIEFKPSSPDANALAQLFLALLSAAKINSEIDFDGLRIYGLLTDALKFSFYSYDPKTKQFGFDEEILISNKRPTALVDMIDVSNKIFGLVLSAYMEGLRATIEKSKDRAKSNDFTDIGSSPEEQRKNKGLSKQQIVPNPTLRLIPLKLSVTGRNSGRKSTDQWEIALGLAEACCAKFSEAVTSVDDIEEKGNEALSLLLRSVHSIPRQPQSTTKDESSMPDNLKDLANRLVDEAYKQSLTA